MELKIEKEKYDSWKQKNADEDDSGYSVACFTYAERWADAIEARMKDGATLESVAEECQPKGMGITGFQFGCSVGILAKSWIHGEPLRQWHNADMGQPEAKGICNPALLTISTKQ